MTVWQFEEKVALNPATSTLSKGKGGSCYAMSDTGYATPLQVSVGGAPVSTVVVSTAQGSVPQLSIDDAQTAPETLEQVRWRSSDGAHVMVLTSFTRVLQQASQSGTRDAYWTGAAWVVDGSPVVTPRPAWVKRTDWHSPLVVLDPGDVPPPGDLYAGDYWLCHQDQP